MSRSSLFLFASIPALLLACSSASTESGAHESDSLSKAPPEAAPPVSHPIETSPGTPTAPKPPTGERCGFATCAAGEVCCNESCGICTAPGGACTQAECLQQPPPPEQPACVKTGCSGEICSDQQIATTCEWSPAFACYANAACERQADGQCGFTQTPALTKCIADAK